METLESLLNRWARAGEGIHVRDWSQKVSEDAECFSTTDCSVSCIDQIVEAGVAGPHSRTVQRRPHRLGPGRQESGRWHEERRAQQSSDGSGP